MRYILAILVLTAAAPLFAQNKSAVPAAEFQIRQALLAAPSDKKDSASVYGYDSRGEMKLLREGTNELVCVSDDPSAKGFSVSCYHRDLQPFMQRGKELRKMGKNQQEIFETREKESISGTLKLPKQPTTLYVYSAADTSVNASTGEVSNGYLRYVVYIPFATAASTGLTEKPEAPGMPWIMHPGTHGAHIMINPPK